MSARLPSSLMDENPELQKQIGCMNGIFQLFNRHHFPSSRRVSSHNHKRLPPGQSANDGMEHKSTTQKAIEKNLKEAVNEKQRVSVEPSRTSFSSSSCSSTFSSVDCTKIAQPEAPSLGHQSLDIRDVVKDSICKETSELSVKTTTKAKGVSRVVKNVDSPRPRMLSNEEKSRASRAKDAPRFSYDGRESQDKWKSVTKLKELPRLSLDSRERSISRSTPESIPNIPVEDLRRGIGKTSQTLIPQQEPESNKRPSSVVAKLMGLEVFSDSTSGENDHIREIKCCPNEDLDTLSASSRTADESKHNKASGSPRTPQKEPVLAQLRNVNPVVKPKSRFPLEPAPWRQPGGNRGSHKQALRYQEAHTKAQNPWSSVYGEIEKRLTELEFKRSGKDLRALKQILEAMEKTRERPENKKENHVSDLEPQSHGPSYLNIHQNSMLAVQHRQITPTIKKMGPLKKPESPIVVVEKSRNSGSSAIPMEGIAGLRKLRTRDNGDSRKDSVDNRTAKDLTPRKNQFREPFCQPVQSMDKSINARTPRSTKTSKAPQLTGEDNPASTSVSPRMQKKIHGMEKQSRPTTQISDSSRARGHLSKQQIPSSSPSRKFKPKSPNLQQGGNQLSEFSCETRHFSQGDAISEQSESNLSFSSQTDLEVTSSYRSKESNVSFQHKDQKKEIAVRSSKDRSKAEPTTASMEQPSPVSVLDFYREESPSPVKKISNAFRDEETLNSDGEWDLVDLDHSMNSTRPNLSLQFDQEKFENIKYLVQKLRQVNSKHDEASTDHIASLCENTNADHRYITEILLASGILLKDVGSIPKIIQLQQSHELINPNLFLVLEQTKGSIEQLDDEHSLEKIDQSQFNEKLHRKLIFDTVNEILVRKVTSAGFSEPWISPNKLGVQSLSGRKLLKELCSGIDHLKAKPECSLGDEDDGLLSILSEDMMHQTQDWEDYHTEVPGAVLDIERLIFKDLISEIVSGEAAGLHGRPIKHCRQLFSK